MSNPSRRTGSVLITRARLVPVPRSSSAGASMSGTAARSARCTDPVDVRVRDGVIAELGSLTPDPGERVLSADGRWMLPGLWDQHVHLTQWAQARDRVDVSGTAGPAEVCRIVAHHLDRVQHLAPTLAAQHAGSLVIGIGYRSAAWQRQPTVAELDAVSGERPVVLISGDCHNGWLNSAALRRLGLPPRQGAVDELVWFDAYARLAQLPEVRQGSQQMVAQAVQAAAARGVVGLVDFEFGGAFRHWPGWFAAGIDQVRVRASTYAEDLDEVIAAGWRTGDRLDTDAAGGLLTLGPLKIISDGSLNTRTAFCCDPYADVGGDFPRGKQNHTPAELVTLLERARAAGLEAAVHAIGDAAVTIAVDAFARTGARGSIEHAQLICEADLPRLASLGLRASVQPGHLIDDRDVVAKCWPGRGHRCFPFAAMTTAGVQLAFGSDAPVSALDPWAQMAAAVHRSGDGRDGWHPEQSLTVGQTLAASTDARPGPHVGGTADLILVDRDPYAAGQWGPQAAAQLQAVRVEATMLAGRITHQGVTR